jgi:hypothetical protein
MKTLSLSFLVASVASAGLLVGATSSSAYAGCVFSKLGTPTVNAAGDSPGGWFSASPDSNALGVALGGAGAIAALGSAVVVRQRRLAQAAANDATLAAEADLSVTTEVVLLPDTAESVIDAIESDLLAGLRR